MALALAAFVAGLLGGVHCAGMCGGIAAALSATAPGPAFARALAFNSGRIVSYSFAGALAGATGALLAAAGPVLFVQAALFVAANVLMLMLGLYVAGVSRAVVRLEGAGGALWARLASLRRALFPVDSTARALAAGAVWGWVPCGLVYGMLALALASGDALSGAMVMIAFGLGTAPTLLAAGMAAHLILSLRRIAWVRHLAGGLLVALALIGFARVPGLTDAVRAGWLCIAG